MTVGQIILLCLWAGIILIAIIIELFLTSYLFLITSLSCIAPLVIVFFYKEWWSILVQLGAFGASWFILFFLFWKIFKKIKFFNSYSSKLLNTLVGRTTVLTKPSYIKDHPDFQYGIVKIDGKYFRTINENEKYLPESTLVIIDKIIGNKLIVKTYNK
ncbi:NfeD family protein [[Mycoplasma] cavipharyngis]|uniref:NfeD family protein n=1 Tax=[Mycoplasma] cavipharyngis TaxID=92757 RepID=UPI0037048313